MYWYRGTLGAAQIGFTDRALGNLALHVPDDEVAVRRRRGEVEAELGVPEGSTLYLDQVHGIAVADADLGGIDVPTADAAVSATGRPLAVMVADCVPVLFVGSDPAHPELCVTAVAHAGRNGLLGGVLPATVAAVKQRGATKIEAVVGPSVCGACYEVPEDMAAEAERMLPGVRATTRWGTPALDLPSSAVRILEGLGVAVTRLSASSSNCTLENPELSSHRRDPSSGRIAGIVMGPRRSGVEEDGAVVNHV